MIADLFFAWTPLAIAIAIASGLVMGETTHRLLLFRDSRRMAWTLLIVGGLWYIPNNIRLAVDPALNVNVVRNLGPALLWLVCYVGVAVMYRWWRDRA